MPVYLYKRDGSKVYATTESQALDLLRTGEYAVRRSESFSLSDAEGNVTRITGEGLQEALESGSRFASPREQFIQSTREAAEGETGKAFAAGAARGLTLGLSDTVLTETGIVDPTVLDALRETNPAMSMAGEIAGGIAGAALLPGGASLKVAGAAGRAGASTATALNVAKSFVPAAGAARVGANVASRMEGLVLKALTGGLPATMAQRAIAKGAALTAAGAVEGSLVGVGQAITEAALGDVGEVGELLAAAVGPATLIGAGAGGVFGIVGGLGGAAFSKLFRKAEEAISESIGVEAPKIRVDKTLEALGVPRREALRKLGGNEARLAKAVDTLLDPDVLDDGKAIVFSGASTGEVVERTKQAVSRYGQNIDAIISGLDDVAQRLDVEPGIPPMRPTEEMIPFGADLNYGRALPGETANPTGYRIDPARDMPSKTRMLDRVEKLIEEKYAGKIPFRGGLRALKEIQQTLGEEAPFMSFREAQMQKVAFQSAFKQNRLLRSVGDKKDAWRDFSKIVSDEIEDAAEAVLGKIGQPDVLHIYRRSKAIYHDLVELSQLGSKHFAEAGDTYLNEITKRGKEFVRGLTWRLVYSGRGAVSAARMAGVGIGLRQGVRGVTEFFAPSKVAQLANDTARLRMIQQKAEEYANRVDGIVESVLSGGRYAAPTAVRILNDLTGERDELAAYKTHRDQMQRYAEDPGRLANDVALALGGVEETAPSVAIETSATVARAIQAIAEAVPQPRREFVLQPDLDYEPTQEELSRYRNVVAAALRPESVLQDIIGGAATMEQVAVVGRVYPRMLEDWRQVIASRAATMKEKLPYHVLVDLSALLGLPTDPTLAQGFIERSQLAWAPQPPKGQPRGTPPKFDQTDLAGIMTTPQRLERRM